ncbi:MAG TPA: di-heme oxidoredictase family protein [Myxococcota bacterium]|nr:di-heme oxidoredictase family protein [Myxococcota bacterium]
MCLGLLTLPAYGDETDSIGDIHEPAAEHVDQHELVTLVKAGQNAAAFEEAFEGGDELFETVFNALDGVGANVGPGQRFTRVPRADLRGFGEWANHVPKRETGPNAAACNSCHNLPADDGAGATSSNVHRDPQHSADMSRFIQRNTPHVFAPGAVQRLAEEITTALQDVRENARRDACFTRRTITRQLLAKGVSYGSIIAVPRSGNPCASLDTSRVVGVDPDLVVRPFQWKGSVAFLRNFNRDASHNELGMQAVELVGEGLDGDGDQVADEMTIGDQTALAVYLASQPRPTTRGELARLRLIPALTPEEATAIRNGASLFNVVGCADCHQARMRLDDPIFREPSRHPAYRDALFPSGANPVALEVDPAFPVRFDLTRDQPDNKILDSAGRVIFRLGSIARDSRGVAQVELYGDLKRHDIGAEMAEPIDEKGTGPSVFLTENLWGVGSTGPWMHDGRATTLGGAIALHGGEAASSRGRFQALSTAQQKEVIAFLDNLVLFKLPEE